MAAIHIIGLGICQPPWLDAAALTALQQAQVVYGSPRQLQSVAHLLTDHCQREILPKLPELTAHLTNQLASQQQVAVLASGDPLFYGIGKYLLDKFPQQATCHSNLSSAQGACQIAGLALQDTQVISLHGRPLHSLRSQLRAGKHCVILTDAHSQPQHLAQECRLAGLENSLLHVVQRIGYDDQSYQVYGVSELINAPQLAFDPLHVSVIEAKGKHSSYPNFPGIKDTDFITDGNVGKGLLTKREVRLAVLSLLQAGAGEIGWDVGAGCGGVAVEWALWNPQGQVYAIEHHQQRFACLQANQEKFGVVQNLYTINALAPQAFAELPKPHKVFVGGSGGALADILAAAWQALQPGGRLLASAVTEQTKATLLQFSQSIQKQPAEMLQVAISRADTLAGHDLMRPSLPVNLLCWDKPHD